MADTTIVTANQITDRLAKRLGQKYEQEFKPDEEVLEGAVVDDAQFTSKSQPAPSNTTRSEEQELTSRVIAGEWDNLDDLPAFQKRTDEGKLMARTEAIDFRIRQLESRLSMLLNQHLHDAYIQVLKKIHALRKTKGALFYFAYKNEGQRDISG